MKRDNKQTNKEGQIIASIIALFLLFAFYTNCHGQSYLSLSVGTATNYNADNAVLTYGADFRHQPGLLGVKVAFNQTDGIYHTFDSYSAHATIEPLRAVHFLVGYRYDNSRGWHYNRNGVNAGVGILIPVNRAVSIKIEGNHTFNYESITNLLVGFQLRIEKPYKRPKRFF